MHTASGVRGVAGAVARRENVEGRVGLWTGGVTRTSIYRLEGVVPVLFCAKASLDAIDLDEGRDYLSMHIG